MLRLLAKIYIQRSLDYGVPVPNWVHRRLKRDHVLANFQRQLVSLQDNLKSEAPAWLNTQVQPERQSVSLATNVNSTLRSPTVRLQFPTDRQSIAYLTMAAIAVLAAGLFLVSYETKPVIPSQNIAHLSKDPSIEIQTDKMVKLAVDSAGKFMQQVESLGLSKDGSSIALDNMLSQVGKNLPTKSNLNQWNAKSVAFLRDCVGTAGRSSGQFLNEVGSGFRGSEADLSNKLEGSANSVRQYWTGWTHTLTESFLPKP